MGELTSQGGQNFRGRARSAPSQAPSNSPESWCTALAEARDRRLVEGGVPSWPGERRRRRRIARLLLWAASVQLEDAAELSSVAVSSIRVSRPSKQPESIEPSRSRSASELPLCDSVGLGRWRSRVARLLAEHLDAGRDHPDLDLLVQLLEQAPTRWPSSSQLAQRAALAGAGHAARSARVRGLIAEGRSAELSPLMSPLLSHARGPAQRSVALTLIARVHAEEQRPRAAGHALEQALVAAPLAPGVWLAAHGVARRLRHRDLIQRTAARALLARQGLVRRRECRALLPCAAAGARAPRSSTAARPAQFRGAMAGSVDRGAEPGPGPRNRTELGLGQSGCAAPCLGGVR